MPSSVEKLGGSLGPNGEREVHEYKHYKQYQTISTGNSKDFNVKSKNVDYRAPWKRELIVTGNTGNSM